MSIEKRQYKKPFTSIFSVLICLPTTLYIVLESTLPSTNSYLTYIFRIICISISITIISLSNKLSRNGNEKSHIYLILKKVIFVLLHGVYLVPTYCIGVFLNEKNYLFILVQLVVVILNCYICLK